MSAFLLALLLASATGSAMGLLAWLFARGRAAGPRWVRAAYALAVLALLVPWRPSLPVRVPERAAAPAAARVTGLRVRLEMPVLPARASTHAAPGPSAAQVAFGVWLAGACLTLVALLWRHVRFLRLARRWRVRDWALESRLLSLDAPRAPIWRLSAPRVYRCPAVGAPTLAGALRPALYLPTEDAPDELALRHELAHLRARDLLLRAAWALARAAHWWNPFVYWLERGCVFACEAAADERVLRGRSAAERRRYARAVLDSAAARPFTPLTMCFQGGKRTMKRRLSLILRPRHGRLGALLLALALLAGLCAPLTRAASDPVVIFGGNTLSGTRLDPVINGLRMGVSGKEIAALAGERGWELWDDGGAIHAIDRRTGESSWYLGAGEVFSVSLRKNYAGEAEAREAARELVRRLEALYGPYDKVMENPYDARWEEDNMWGGASSRVRIAPLEASAGPWLVDFTYTGIPFATEYVPDAPDSPPGIADPSWAGEEADSLLRAAFDRLLAGYGLTGGASENAAAAQAMLTAVRARRCVAALIDAADDGLRERFLLELATMELIPAASGLLQEEPGTVYAALAREFLADVSRTLRGDPPADFGGWEGDDLLELAEQIDALLEQ